MDELEEIKKQISEIKVEGEKQKITVSKEQLLDFKINCIKWLEEIFAEKDLDKVERMVAKMICQLKYIPHIRSKSLGIDKYEHLEYYTKNGNYYISTMSLGIFGWETTVYKIFTLFVHMWPKAENIIYQTRNEALKGHVDACERWEEK